MWANRVLSRREVFGFFLAASMLYAFPVIHADFRYIDDNWRSLLLEYDLWRDQGRILLDFMLKGLSFAPAKINMFPLPLLIAMFVIATAMTSVTLYFFSRPSLMTCLVFLPLLCNPFFLGNLTYQYDGPGMVLAVAAALYALTNNAKSTGLRCAVSALLIAVVLGLYQLTVSVFVGLCVVEFVWSVRNKLPVKDVLSAVLVRGLQLIVGGVIYFLTAFQSASSERGRFLPLDSYWLEQVGAKLMFTLDKVMLLFNPVLWAIAVVLLAAAATSYLIVVKQIPEMTGSILGKAVISVLYLLVVPILALCVPGVMLLLVGDDVDARNYIGFSVVLVFVFLLSHELFIRVFKSATCVLVVPTVFMFSLCYAYGQVLIAKKELQTATATYIAYDLMSYNELNTKKVFYYLSHPVSVNWIPGAHGAMTQMPVQRYILSSSNAMLFPEFFPRIGITNVVNGYFKGFQAEINALKTQPCKTVVNNPFYAICVVGDSGFITLKYRADPEDYTEQFKRD
ncbi:O-antigen conversion protein C [Pseudomonas sp. 22 E 5]|uniref:glucosyltransferase domain-containing protein n=1 Tax=Pseudomonas fluorescens TaxID=294 RepID=UPI0002F1D31D|nr:glucosyltransferase domain-containing protein [Pseudomonas fluorescens]CRM96599.1 O-antigen conversion protein C [Pseudomonas sp. 22 E 5]